MTGVEAGNEVGAGIVVFNFGLAVVDVEVGIYVSVAEGVIPANTDFPTACAEMTGVYIGSVCTKGSGHFVNRSKHVFGVALEPVECEVERVVEETEVKTYVGGDYTFPSEVAGYESRSCHHADFCTAGVEPVYVGAYEVVDSGEETVVAHGFVTDMAIGSANLTVRDDVCSLDRLEVGFFGEAVACGERGEPCPLVVGGEARRTVAADIGFKEVDAFVVVVDTSEETGCCAVGKRVVEIYGCAVVATGGEAQVGKVVVHHDVAANPEVVVVVLFGCSTDHHLEVVGIGKRLGVGSVDVGVPHVHFGVVLVNFGVALISDEVAKGIGVGDLCPCIP